MKAGALGLALVAAAACATPFEARYAPIRTTVAPPPVPTACVRVYPAQSPGPADAEALGRYWGAAPTLADAIERARRSCGHAGADVFKVRITPYEVGGRWQVEGYCLATPTALASSSRRACSISR